MNSKEVLEKLRHMIGEEKYNQVVNELAGTTVYFPANTEWQDKNTRNIHPREDFYSGQFEIADLAKKYNLSISRVYKIVQNRE